MGWTSIEYNSRHGLFGDLELWTLRHFFLDVSRELDANSADAADLVRFFVQWDWLGPGVIVGIDFQGYIGNSGPRKRLILLLLSRTIERLHRFGSSIPLSYLNEHVNEKGRGYSKEQPVEPFVAVARQLYDLIDKGLPQI